MCPYGDKDDRCSLMMRLNKKFYCENYGSTCCESCFKTARRPEVTTPFPVFISARRPDTAASRIRSQTQSQSEPKASASRSANSSRNNLEKVRENLKRFVTFINQIFSRNNNVGWEKTIDNSLVLQCLLAFCPTFSWIKPLRDRIMQLSFWETIMKKALSIPGVSLYTSWQRSLV